MKFISALRGLIGAAAVLALAGMWMSQQCTTIPDPSRDQAFQRAKAKVETLCYFVQARYSVNLKVTHFDRAEILILASKSEEMDIDRLARDLAEKYRKEVGVLR